MSGETPLDYSVTSAESLARPMDRKKAGHKDGGPERASCPTSCSSKL
jgi:hypothetical protein